MYVPGSGQALDIGLENLFIFNNFLINDLTQTETIVITELAGFEDADVRRIAEENPEEDGEQMYPPFYGGRSMTMTGYIRAGSVHRMRDMRRDLRRAFKELVERPLIIKKLWDPSQDIYIYCMKQDKISSPEHQTDWKAERDFQIMLRASDPRYLSTTVKQVTIEPSFVTELGRFYDRTYDLIYDTPMDPTGHRAEGGANTGYVLNLGDWRARPKIRFTGYLAGVTLTNYANNKAIRLSQPVAEGDYLEIDFANGTAVDSAGNRRWDLVSTVSDIMVLEGVDQVAGGVNPFVLSVSAFAGGGQVMIEWQDTSL